MDRGWNPHGQSEKGEGMKGFIVDLGNLNRAEAKIGGEGGKKQKGSCEQMDISSNSVDVRLNTYSYMRMVGGYALLSCCITLYRTVQ